MRGEERMSSTPTVDAGEGLLAPAIPQAPVWRLSVAQYHQMLAAGILNQGDPIELLEGWLVPQTTENPAHSLAAELVRVQLEGVVPNDWHVQSPHPVTTDDSEPEPDASVVRGK